jgi:hypothetical protein
MINTTRNTNTNRYHCRQDLKIGIFSSLMSFLSIFNVEYYLFFLPEMSPAVRSPRDRPITSPIDTLLINIPRINPIIIQIPIPISLLV